MKTAKPALTLILALLVAGVVMGSSIAVGEGESPSKQDPALAPIADTPALPRVLLIGDSISIGYTLGVRARLVGRANVHRPRENCESTDRGLARLDKWLEGGPWAVIHFNFGLHDLKYLDEQGRYVSPERGRQVTPLAQYDSNLRSIVARLRQTGASLVFATTTPVPKGASGRVEGDELRYNETAVRVMREDGVAIDDLHAVVAPSQSQLQQPKNVHFTAGGYMLLADAVAASIGAALSPAAR